MAIARKKWEGEFFYPISRQRLITAWSEGLSNQPEDLRTLQKAELYYQEVTIKTQIPFSLQLTRKDSPIPDDEVIPALLMEKPDVIASFLDQSTEQRLTFKKGALQVLKSALDEGAPIQNLQAILRALEIDEI